MKQRLNNNIDLEKLFDSASDDSSSEVANEVIYHKYPRTKRNMFCAIYSPIATDSKEDFFDLMKMLKEMSDAELSGEITLSLANIDEYWDIIQYFKSRGPEYKDLFISDFTNVKENDSHKAAQHSLWTKGESVYDMGTDPMNYDVTEEDLEPELVAIIDDKETLLSTVYDNKKQEMVNARDSILKCLPETEFFSLTTEHEKEDKLLELLDEFDKGNISSRLNPEKYRYPKEAGVMLPHTMGPQDWLATTVVNLMDHLYGGSVTTAFENASMTDVRAYSGKECEFLMFSGDGDSPYAIDVNPAIYCNDYDEKGQWMWRGVQQKVNSKLKTISLERELDPVQREQLRKEVFREHAIAMKGQSPVRVTWSKKVSALGIINLKEPDPEFFSGKTMIVRFFKRGYSKLNEVDEYNQYVHIVSAATAKSTKKQNYERIVLPDFNSVVLIPTRLWQASPFSAASTYRSPYGATLFDGDTSVVDLYVALFCMSQVRNMFSCWAKSTAYDYKLHGTSLIKFASIKGTYANVFKAPLSKKVKDRESFLLLMNRVIPGPLTGLIIAAKTSKVGKRSANKLSKHARFSVAMDDYNRDDVEYAFDGNMFGGLVDSVDSQRGDSDSSDQDYSYDTGVDKAFSLNGFGQGSGADVSSSD